MYNDNVVERPRVGSLMLYRGKGGQIAQRLFGASGRNSMLSLFDQGLVSGANFFASVVVGRFAGPAELGLYFLGFTLIALLTSAQISLISVPHTIYVHRREQGDRATYDGSVLAHQMLLSAVVVLALVITSAALWAEGSNRGAAAVAATLAIVVPFVLLREFGRRYCFAHMKIAGGLLIDFCAVTLQVVLLIWLSQVGKLTAVSALATMGASCAVSSVGWLWASRARFHVVLRQAIDDLSHNFALAKWVFASECGASLLTLSGPWLTAAMLGKAEAGIYAACVTLAQAVNPVVFGTCNILAPRAAQSFMAGGIQEVRRVVLQVMVFVGAALVVWCGFLLLYGESVIGVLYGDGFANSMWIVTMLGAAVMVRSLGMVTTQGLQTIERPQFGLWSNLVSLVMLAAFAPILIPRWGVFGAAASIFIADGTGFLIRLIAFSRLSTLPVAEAESNTEGISQPEGALEPEGALS